MMTWQKVKLAALGIALVATAATSVGVAAPALARRPKQDQAAKPTQAAADVRASKIAAAPTAPDPRFLRTLSSGTTIEVLGVSPHPSGQNTWWRPDGTPLAAAPCDPFRANIGAAGDVVMRAVVVRVTHLPPGAELRWQVKEANGGAQGGAEFGGKPVPGLREGVSAFPRALRNCTVRFEVASGDWKTVQTWAGSVGAVGSATGNYIFSAAIASKKGTTWSVTHDLHDVAVRLVAVDKDGEEHAPAPASSAGVKDFVQIAVEFSLPPEQIREFRVKTRPYEVVEIPGVALATAKSE